jgi:GGDEF domain-containing protein
MVVAERLRSLVEHGAWEHGSLTVSGGVVGWAQADAPTPTTAGKPLVIELHPSGRIARNPAAPRGKAEEAGAPRAPEPLSPSLLVERASRALERAKALGKNVVVAYEPALDAAELAS